MEVVLAITKGRGLDCSEEFFLDKIASYAHDKIVELILYECTNVPETVFNSINLEHVRFLTIRNFPRIPNEFAYRLMSCKNINSLKIQGDIHNMEIIPTISKNNNLTFVSLKHTTIIPTVFPYATHIHIQNVVGLTANMFPSVKSAQVYQNANFLVELILAKNILTTIETDYLHIPDYIHAIVGKVTKKKMSIVMLQHEQSEVIDDFMKMYSQYVHRIEWVKKLRNFCVVPPPTNE